MQNRDAELIQQYSRLVRNGDGSEYTIQSWAKKSTDGKWEGWLEYHPIDDTRPIRKTPPETSQPGRRELIRWAAALGERYLESGFARSK